jgi:predicted small metal-binding protein
MAKELNCRDVGFECDGVVTGETEDEVLAKAADHAQSVHGMTDAEVGADGFVEKVRGQVHEKA